MAIRKSVILGALCFVAAGCAQTESENAPGPGIKTPPPTSIEQPAKPPAEVTNPADTVKVAPEPSPRPKDKPIGFSIDPETLINLSADEVLEKMGPPMVKREEPPAVIWSYIRGECRLDIYLYESLNTEILRSLTYIVETTRKDVDAKTYCLSRAK
jgi:hypothetical protein